VRLERPASTLREISVPPSGRKVGARHRGNHRLAILDGA
jgi:hypothetical protein